MRIFLAGATGVIGRPLVTALLGAGHEVVGLLRTPEKARVLEAKGAEPALADALDHGAPGVYNVTDDEPAPAHEWIPELARLVGAKPPAACPPGWCDWWPARRR
jgi:nucleoside-diphosphate-sugar epimerase